jgi:hypothetical protein
MRRLMILIKTGMNVALNSSASADTMDKGKRV